MLPEEEGAVNQKERALLLRRFCEGGAGQPAPPRAVTANLRFCAMEICTEK